MDGEYTHTPDEKKHWVRITGACNNRCLFCLDKDTMDGSIRPFEEVVADLRTGIERGAARAIISGGEASIHPRFADIIAAASGMGYTWIQTITNGRMFYYRDFVDKAVRAGLREVTFSLHGHTPELFEKLTGTPGSFKQALTGFRNAVSTPGLVVSVDIVVCGINAPFLKDIVKFYRALGAREFDLLYTAPFGGAWSNRDEALADQETAASAAAAEVLPLAESLGVTFWTNRFPARTLEGFENFIQSPEKMHDEVYGRSAMFMEFLRDGVQPPCMDERCRFCNMSDFCRMLNDERQAEADGRSRVYLITSENVESLNSLAPGQAAGLVLYPPELKVHPAVQRIMSEGNVKATYRYRAIPEGLTAGTFPIEEVEILLDKRTAPKLLARGAPELPVPVHIALPNYSTSRECFENSTSIRTFFKHMELPRGGSVSIRNVPPCVSLSGEYAPLEEIPPGLRAPGGAWDLERLTDYFIASRYYQKSSRCAGCRHFERCPGLHINYIRAFGFSEIAGPSACAAPEK